ncbi:hypothetical protein RNZ50_26675 [Paracoccaceae bacterium Fryx2]|nr:hypothetical protein [Paracoccaceae bacterium Fryx2]
MTNFKRPVKYRGTPSWKFKVREINAVANAFSANIGEAFGAITLVPVPPSKLKTDAEYDDRMMDMLRALRAPAGLVPDVRELVVQTMPMPAAHESANRPPPVEWEKVCGFRGEWALISRDRGHAFRAILGSHFTGSWAGWPTLSWSQA